MLKFKIKAFIYACQCLRYEKGMFKENYRNRLVSQIIENTHLHSEVIYGVFGKMTKCEIENLISMYYDR